MSTAERNIPLFNPRKMALLEFLMFKSHHEHKPLKSHIYQVRLLQEQFKLTEESAHQAVKHHESFIIALQAYLLAPSATNRKDRQMIYDELLQPLVAYHLVIAQETGLNYDWQEALVHEFEMLDTFLEGDTQVTVDSTGWYFSTIYQIPIEVLMPAMHARERALAVLRGISEELPATDTSWQAIKESLMSYYQLLDQALRTSLQKPAA